MSELLLPQPNRPDELAFVALGGVGEIGMNLSLYGYGGRWLMIDCGITFADDTMPGVEILMADPGFIAERRAQLVGLIATHAHEDHIGAIPYLWPRLGCPVYATPFTAAVLRQKLIEAGLEREVPLIEVPMSGRFTVGPFEIELVTLTHSIPEPNAVALRTPLGTVLHTGDWKFDPEPLVGDHYDLAALERLGDEGVLALICDSTNALRAGDSGSEAAVRRALVELVGRCANRVVIACFASNVARLASAAAAAAAHDRHVALIGRSLWRIAQAARATGYLDGVADFLTEEDAAYLPRDKVLLVCTGSQGEPRSALVRIAADEHAHITLEADDTAIFSSRVIPGNERAIGRLHNALVRRGVEVITEHDHFVHVSGHPARDELQRMYGAVRPTIALPVHGEARHLRAQALLAADCRVPQPLVTRNGEVVKLAPGPAAVIGEVPTGRLAADGKALLDAAGETLKSRQRMTFNGVALATIVLGGPARGAAPGHGAGDRERERRRRMAGERRRGDRGAGPARARRRRGRARSRAARRAPHGAGALRQAAGGGDSSRAVAAMIGRLNHVAIAVPDLEAAAAVYRDVLGAQVSAPVALAAHGVTTVFVTLANTKLELVAPLGEASPLHGFLARNPAGGIHHLCYEVADIRAARDRLVAAGARILGDGTPRAGAHGRPVLFLHPKDFCGTLVELEEA
jgi:ribonuclease J